MPPRTKLKLKLDDDKPEKSDQLGFMYYPDIESEDFFPHLWAKKEFLENKSPARPYYEDAKKQKELLKKICSPDVLKLKNHQTFLRNYLSPETPYNSILVYHGVGTGKTCAGVSIAEGLKEMVEKYNKKIYVITGSLLQANFRKNLYDMGREESRYPGSLQCTKATYYLPKKKKEGPEGRKAREKAIRDMQKKYYEYMGYIAFVHFVDKQVLAKGYDLGEFFSNCVFIIDEAHNLIAKSGTKTKIEERRKTRQKLHDIFRVAKNTKCVMLTATPITNEIDDIVVLINLLRANDKKKQYTPNDLTTNNSSKITKENLNTKKFIEFVKGYVSYYRGAHPSSFPQEFPMHEYSRKIDADLYGDQLDKKVPNFKELSIIACEMSEFHFYNYFTHNMKLERNMIAGIRSKDAQGDTQKIEAGTAMYPLEDKDDERVGTYRFDEVFIKDKIKGRIEKFKYRTKEKFLDIDRRNEKYLHDPRARTSADTTIGYPLAKYSSKFYRLFYDIVNNFGINFVFTRYKTDVGTMPISLLLEQNGYVRYHRNLGKPNEFTGKYREGVQNQLDTRDLKYRCICGYLDEEHNPKYTGKDDFSNPGRHRFLQGTYVRIDGDTSDDWENYISTVFNSSENKYGKVIKVLIGGANFREGIDLKHVRTVHIMNPWHNLIQIEQTIGRAIRMCSHSSLDNPSEMTVKTYKYVSIPPQAKLSKKFSIKDAIEDLQEDGKLELDGVKFKNKKVWQTNIKSDRPEDWESIDEYIYARALNKDYNIKYAERLMKMAAVDCYLNREANVNFPNQKDGSRVCDYTECEYQCVYDFKPPTNPNLDTYDLYFMEPKVQDAQEVIGDLYSRNWALTLDSIVDLTRKQESKLTKDVIYLALNRMLGDPPKTKPTPVKDKYDRIGYLIYRHPFYVYQPREVTDEDLPYYNRRIPSRGRKTEIDIKNIIKPKKRQIIMKKPLERTSPSERLSIKPASREMKTSQTKFASNIEAILAPIQGYDDLELARTLDYLTRKQHEYILRTRIEEWCEKPGNQFTRKIIIYYLENFLLANPKMSYDEYDQVKAIPKNKEWVYNIAGHFWRYDCGSGKWLEVHEDSDIMGQIKKQQESPDGPRFFRLSRDTSPKMYGYLYDDNKKREIKFKITDIEGQEVKTKRYSEEINIKTQHRGQVCVNYSNEELEKLCERLKVKYDENLQRNSLCYLIERELRERDRTDKKYTWILNFYDYKRKMERLEPSDIRSFYNFYLSG